MRDHYDFSRARKNPYVKEGEGKTIITLRLGTRILWYFKSLEGHTGVPFQVLINSCLSDCAARELKPVTEWK